MCSKSVPRNADRATAHQLQLQLCNSVINIHIAPYKIGQRIVISILSQKNPKLISVSARNYLLDKSAIYMLTKSILIISRDI